MTERELIAQALERMILGIRLFSERNPNAIIAGVVFSIDNGIVILPTIDSKEGYENLKACLQSCFDKEPIVKPFSNRDN